MQFIGIIPARYASSRFPGKPLAMIQGKSMIQRVYEQASKADSLEEVFVATDDLRIQDHVLSFGGKVFMTDTNHPSGTDRCNEVVQMLQSNGQSFDVVVNIQGDEPMLEPNQILELMNCFEKPQTNIATLVTKVNFAEELNNKSSAFVIYDVNMRAIYFSRTAIPAVKGLDKSEWFGKTDFYKHIGMYALEQLRWLENGFSIQTKITDCESYAVDTPEDLLKLTNIS